jgi:5,10-methylenetetrahydromethanopterin reductase
VTKVGLRAASVTEFERYLVRLQGYLSGAAVEQDSTLARIAWLDDETLAKVPVDVAASGPSTIAVGARVAERVTFNVGADPARVARCIEVADDARAVMGTDLPDLSLGLYLNVAPLDDADAARELVKPVVAVYLRFSGMGGRAVGGVEPSDARVIESVVTNYDMARHGQSDASHLAFLDDQFVDRFSVAGTPSTCIDRLVALADLGIRRFVVVGPAHDGDPALVAESRRQLAQVVLPGVRQALAGR